MRYAFNFHFVPAEARALARAAARACLSPSAYISKAALERAAYENDIADKVAEAARSPIKIISPAPDKLQ